MPELTLESLSARLQALEREFAEYKLASPPPAKKDWRRVAGMFTGSEFMKEVDAAGAAIRAAEPREPLEGDAE